MATEIGKSVILYVKITIYWAESVHSWNHNPGVSNGNKHKTILPRRMSWAGRVTPLGERGVTCRVWVWKPERRRPLGRLICMWKHNIKMRIKPFLTFR